MWQFAAAAAGWHDMRHLSLDTCRLDDRDLVAEATPTLANALAEAMPRLQHLDAPSTSVTDKLNKQGAAKLLLENL